MKRAAAKIVPELLNFKQKQCRMVIAQEMLTTIQICSKGQNWWRSNAVNIANVFARLISFSSQILIEFLWSNSKQSNSSPLHD